MAFAGLSSLFDEITKIFYRKMIESALRGADVFLDPVILGIKAKLS